MATKEDKKTETSESLESDTGESRALSTEPADTWIENSQNNEATDDEGSPTQLGYRRFVYAAYFAAAMLIAFIVAKSLTFAWIALAKWKPNFGEPSEELLLTIGAFVGAGVALYYWRHTRTRELAEDVASELAKVTWPTKKEVANNTMIVIFTTLFATVFFTLMDRFWGFVTNWVYAT